MLSNDQCSASRVSSFKKLLCVKIAYCHLLLLFVFVAGLVCIIVRTFNIIYNDFSVLQIQSFQVMILRNHGIVVVGDTIEEALCNSMAAIRACEYQVTKD